MNLELLKIIADIVAERTKQDEKWGIQDHNFTTWLVILMEEVGEFSKAYLEFLFAKTTLADKQKQIVNVREELIQVCAVAVAMVECFDRKNPKGVKGVVDKRHTDWESQGYSNFEIRTGPPEY